MLLKPGTRTVNITGYWTETIRWNPDNFSGSAVLQLGNGDLVDLDNQDLVSLGFDFAPSEGNMIPSTYHNTDAMGNTRIHSFRENTYWPVQVDDELIPSSPGILYVTVNYVQPIYSIDTLPRGERVTYSYLDRYARYINFPVNIVFGQDPDAERHLHYLKAIETIESVGGTLTRPDWTRYRLTFEPAYDTRLIVPANTRITRMDLRFDADTEPIVPRPYPIIQQTHRIETIKSAKIKITDVDEDFTDDIGIRSISSSITGTIEGFSFDDKNHTRLVLELIDTPKNAENITEEEGEVFLLTNLVTSGKNFTATIERVVEVA